MVQTTLFITVLCQCVLLELLYSLKFYSSVNINYLCMHASIYVCSLGRKYKLHACPLHRISAKFRFCSLELHTLQFGTQISWFSHVLPLNPSVNNRVIRVGSRLKHSQLSYKDKFICERTEKCIPRSHTLIL